MIPTRDQIKAEFDRFIEYPEGSDGKYVTTISALLFAEHIARIAMAKDGDGRTAQEVHQAAIGAGCQAFKDAAEYNKRRAEAAEQLRDELADLAEEVAMALDAYSPYERGLAPYIDSLNQAVQKARGACRQR